MRHMSTNIGRYFVSVYDAHCALLQTHKNSLKDKLILTLLPLFILIMASINDMPCFTLRAGYFTKRFDLDTGRNTYQ
jgi:hypothetical protein